MRSGPTAMLVGRERAARSRTRTRAAAQRPRRPRPVSGADGRGCHDHRVTASGAGTTGQELRALFGNDHVYAVLVDATAGAADRTRQGAITRAAACEPPLCDPGSPVRPGDLYWINGRLTAGWSHASRRSWVPGWGSYGLPGPRRGSSPASSSTASQVAASGGPHHPTTPATNVSGRTGRAQTVTANAATTAAPTMRRPTLAGPTRRERSGRRTWVSQSGFPGLSGAR